MTIQPTFTAQELSAYVTAMGWVQVEKALKDGLYLFKHPEFESRQLMFGLDESFDDYDEALENTARKLAQIYEWSFAEAIRRIEESNSEVLLSRVPDETRHISTVSFTYALQVMEAQKELLLAGAAANDKRQAHYAKTNVGDGKKMLEAAQFRHTEAGSFIFKTSCRLYEFEGDSTGNISLFSAEEVAPPLPFVRRAMLNIGTGLEDLVRSIEDRQEDRLVEDIKERAASPISSNFCQAVAELRDREHPHSIDLSFAWSPLLALPPEAPTAPIRIKTDYFPVIEDIGKALQPAKKPIRSDYIGTVEELRGTFNKLGQREGEVLILLLAENTKVRVTLTAPQYDEAVAVHKTTKVLVRVEGTIKYNKRQPHGFDLNSFKIMNA